MAASIAIMRSFQFWRLRSRFPDCAEACVDGCINAGFCSTESPGAVSQEKINARLMWLDDNPLDKSLPSNQVRLNPASFGDLPKTRDSQLQDNYGDWAAACWSKAVIGSLPQQAPAQSPQSPGAVGRVSQVCTLQLWKARLCRGVNTLLHRLTCS